MNAMAGTLILSALLFFTRCTGSSQIADPFSDAPETAGTLSVPFKAADSYEGALQVWETPEDINAWVAAHFTYDMQRALRLAETQKAKNERISIYTPAEFFDAKTGVCVDLSRFGVETLKRIDPQSEPKYLMIEFDPVQIGGNIALAGEFQTWRQGVLFCRLQTPGAYGRPLQQCAGVYRRLRTLQRAKDRRVRGAGIIPKKAPHGSTEGGSAG